MPRPWPTTPPTPADRAAYADAVRASFWLDALPQAAAAPEPLPATEAASLCIVGGGFTGLWAALHAKADDPARDVVLLEAGRVGGAASGRNGGFCVSSLTHGLAAAAARYPDEAALLDRLGLDNYRGLVADLRRHGIDCDLEETGELTVALEPHQLAGIAEEADLLERFGHDFVVFDGEEMRAALASPTYVGGVWDRTGAAVLHPGKLVAGLRAAAERAGVRIYEQARATRLESVRSGVCVRVAPAQGGQPAMHVRADRVLLASGAHRSLAPAVRRRIAPVYDYVLMTEPLSAEQRAAIGWSGRQGVGDSANQFHYYRLTADHRILWGGYDAIYRYGGPVDARYDEREASFAGLSQRFFTTFPQLRGLRFTHRWGGAIDTCSRFSVFFGTTHGGQVSYAAGYTGLGVGAARFGARVALDLVDGRETEATRTQFVRDRPMPFPPEPLRSAAIAVTQRALEAADASDGRRGPWLRTLDRFGVGFDS